MPKTQYEMVFDKQQWEELESLTFTGFEINRETPMARDQWVALGHMCLGKAQRIEEGQYGEPEDDMDDNSEWAEELRAIAAVIFGEFQSGDGKL